MKLQFPFRSSGLGAYLGSLESEPAAKNGRPTDGR
jgi:hypothetical protein